MFRVGLALVRSCISCHVNPFYSIFREMSGCHEGFVMQMVADVVETGQSNQHRKTQQSTL
ncbi:MAG: hypothetical protein H7839_23285 [Magnetococcus sp. YQC-5]